MNGLIKKINKKITWFHGIKYIIITISDAYKSLKYFPNKVNFVEFENSGHAIFIDEKEKFVKLFEDLIKNES